MIDDAKFPEHRREKQRAERTAETAAAAALCALLRPKKWPHTTIAAQFS